METGAASGLPADAVPKIRIILTFLQAMGAGDELRTLPCLETALAHRRPQRDMGASRHEELAHHVHDRRRRHRNHRLGLRRLPLTAGHVPRKEEHMTGKGIGMKDPAHPGGFIREIVTELELNVTEAAEVLGVTRPALSNLLNQRAALSSEMALRIEKAFGVSMDTLMRMQNAHDIAQARSKEGEISVMRYVPKAKGTPQPSLA